MEFVPDTPVKLKGVAGPQNGMEGRIVGRAGNRYRVRLSSGSLVEVSGRNLQQIVQGATLVNLHVRPELNGQRVRLVAFDPVRGKYQGYLSGSSQPQLIRPKNLILPIGTKVRVAGLLSPKWSHVNGECATIKSFDSRESRYQIARMDGSTISIPLRNCFA